MRPRVFDDDDPILRPLRRAEDAAEIVIVDLLGGASSAGATQGIPPLPLRSESRLTVSMPDVKAAMKSVAQIDDAQELPRVPITRAMISDRILPGFESVPVRQVRAAVEETGSIRIFKSALMERAAFRDMHISGMVPRQKDPKGGPAINVAAIAANFSRPWQP